MNIIFESFGGIGKVVMSTVIVKLLKQKYPNDNLIVVTGHTSIFKNNPYVDHLYFPQSHPAINNLFIQNKKAKILSKEVYLEDAYIQSKEHLLETWAKMYDLEYNGELPELYIDCTELSKFEFNEDKPILVLHPNGASLDFNDYNWSRDLPKQNVLDIIDKYKNDYNIYHVKSKNQLTYPNVIEESGSIRKLICLISKADKIITIDTATQHIAMALRKPSNVFWVTTSPKVFGYSFHNNILANPPEFYTPSDTYCNYNFVEPIENLPYQDPSRIFDANKILNSINN